MENPPTREQLIALCEKGIVDQTKWRNRDTSNAQQQLGQCWALLKAGCEFTVTDDSSEYTYYLDIKFKGFNYFEFGDELEVDLFYVPTEARLLKRAEGDWY